MENYMSISFNTGVNNQTWNEATIRTKLTGLANADKSKQWILKDLSLENSSKAGRCFWAFPAKHMHCMRNKLYSVDTQASKGLLDRLKAVIPEKTDLADLFDKAAGNFEKITKRKVETFTKVLREETPPKPLPKPLTQPPRAVIYTSNDDPCNNCCVDCCSAIAESNSRPSYYSSYSSSSSWGRSSGFSSFSSGPASSGFRVVPGSGRRW